jgi:hypothetical protein
MGARSEVAGNKKSGLRIAQAGIFLGTRLFALGSPAVIPTIFDKFRLVLRKKGDKNVKIHF